MVSDGVGDSLKEELYNIIREFTGGDSTDLAEYIMLKAGASSRDKIKDDMRQFGYTRFSLHPSVQ